MSRAKLSWYSTVGACVLTVFFMACTVFIAYRESTGH
jgi:hypothetical protein